MKHVTVVVIFSLVILRVGPMKGLNRLILVVDFRRMKDKPLHFHGRSDDR